MSSNLRAQQNFSASPLTSMRTPREMTENQETLRVFQLLTAAHQGGLAMPEVHKELYEVRDLVDFHRDLSAVPGIPTEHVNKSLCMIAINLAHESLIRFMVDYQRPPAPPQLFSYSKKVLRAVAKDSPHDSVRIQRLQRICAVLEKCVQENQTAGGPSAANEGGMQSDVDDATASATKLDAVRFWKALTRIPAEKVCDQRDSAGRSILMALALSGDAMLKVLMSYMNRFKPDVNTHSADGNGCASATPLLSALKSRKCHKVVRFLLSMGADANMTLPDGRSAKDVACSRLMLYYLQRAERLFPISETKWDILESLQLSMLPSIRLCAIGQEAAQTMLFDAIFAKYASAALLSRPLVALLPGLPGHGKSQLAEAIGTAIAQSNDDGKDVYLRLDLSQISDRNALLGSSRGYVGSDRETSLVTFLSKFNCQRSVVLLDEIDKFRPGDLDALYPIFEEGRCINQVTDKEIDCRGAIFLLTCNWGQEELDRFCREKPNFLDLTKGPEAVERLATMVTAIVNPLVRKELLPVKRDALVSRFSRIVPFVRFTDEEAKLIACEFLAELQAELFKPPVMTGPQSEVRVVGNFEFEYEEDNMRPFMIKEYKDGQGMSGARAIKMARDRVLEFITNRVGGTEIKKTRVVVEELDGVPMLTMVVLD
eukprot:ANDGO_08429.mRNA.1 Chaperone protein ClpB